MPSNWTKQPMQLNQQRYLNNGLGDTIVGGALTAVPAGVPASQGIQDVPGDRMVLGFADALALSKTANSTLQGGLYQYVRTKATSTATPTFGRLLFWDTTANLNLNLYQTTPDEVTGFIAGVAITTMTKGNSWWIQIAGIMSIKFRASITGTPTVGRGVFAAMAGAGADVGTVDQLVGQSTPVTTGGANNVGIDSLISNYMGVAYTLPVAGAVKLVECPMDAIRF